MVRSRKKKLLAQQPTGIGYMFRVPKKGSLLRDCVADHVCYWEPRRNEHLRHCRHCARLFSTTFKPSTFEELRSRQIACAQNKGYSDDLIAKAIREGADDNDE